jgi:predicted aldo/keto reductase-like oxidoreductase
MFSGAPPFFTAARFVVCGARNAREAPGIERFGAFTVTFLQRQVPALGKTMHRIGLALNYGIDAAGFRHALDLGVNYIFYTSMKTGHLRPTLREVLARDRERYIVATGATAAYVGGSVRRDCERLLKALSVEYLDVFHLFWVGVGSAWNNGTYDALLRLKEEGKVRAIGISIHDRMRAADLARDSALDVLMLRYNAAHPGAERDVFPHLRPEKKQAVVAYTATSWRKLLRAQDGERTPRAADCYRFCLTHPAVDLALMGPANQRELVENFRGLEDGPLSPDEDAWMRRLGQKARSVVFGS